LTLTFHSHAQAHTTEPSSTQANNSFHEQPVSYILSVFGRYLNVEIDTSADVWHQDTSNQNPVSPWRHALAMARAAKLPFEAQRLPLRKLQQWQSMALLHLRAPDQLVIAQAFGTDDTLLWEDGRDRLINNAELSKRYTGEVMIWRGIKKVAWKIDEPIRYLTPDAIGGPGHLVGTVPYRNSGTKPLSVEVVSTSCGCTGATLSSKVVPPGGSGVLTAKMDAIDNRLVIVKLRSDDPGRPHALIALQSRMPQGIMPPATVMLNAQQGQATTASAGIQLPAGVTIIKALANQPWLQATFALLPSTASRPAPSTYRVEIGLGEDAPVGQLQNEITLHLKNGPVQKLIIPINGYVSNDITVSPKLISLGKAPRGRNIRKTVIVRGPANKPFSIRSIRGSNTLVTSRANPDVVATAHAVEIQVSIEGDVGAWLQERVTLSLSDGRTLDVDIIGSVAESRAEIMNVEAMQVGQSAPHFTMADADGIMHRLTDLKGKKNLLLTFFPQCFTGGCAGQLVSLQRELSNFNRRDTVIWAVSVDTPEEQKRFAAQLDLQFPLLPDTERKLSILYNAALEKTDLAARQSILIDKAGVVRWIDTNVNVQTHGVDMLVKMRELNMTSP